MIITLAVKVQFKNGRFYAKNALLGETFVVRMVVRLKYKDGHASGRTFLRNTS